MEKKGRGTRTANILNLLLFIFVVLNVLVAASAYFGSEYNYLGLLFSCPPLFVLCILFFVSGKRDISNSNKLLACIPTASFIWLMFTWRDAVFIISMIVGSLSCLALVILTVLKLGSTRSR